MTDDDSRILMSDSIRGMVPELEDDSSTLHEDAFLIGTLEIRTNDVVEVVTGKLIGISKEPDVTKIDLRLPNRDAYSLFRELVLSDLKCDRLYLHLADLETALTGPFRLVSPKLVDFDHQHKMCTLGVDLVKIEDI